MQTSLRIPLNQRCFTATRFSAHRQTVGQTSHTHTPERRL